MKKVYIAGKITGEKYYKQIFKKAERRLTDAGFKVMNPAVLPAGFDYEDYMQICFSMIDVCDEVHLLQNWEDSEGAKREFSYALATRKPTVFID